MMQGVHAEDCVEGLRAEGQRLSSGRHESGLVAEDQPAVSRETNSAAPHHLQGQVNGDRSYSQPPEQLCGPTRAGCEIQHEIVRARSQEIAGNREVEQIVPAQLRGRPMQREIEAGCDVLLLVGASFRHIRVAIDRGDVLVLGIGFVHL